VATVAAAPRTLRELTSNGYALDPAPEAFGALRSSLDVVSDADELWTRMRRDGYLFLPGYLDRDLVLEARRVAVEKLAAQGHFVPGTPPMAAVARPGSGIKFAPDLAHDNQPLFDLLYDGLMIAFYERFLGGEVRHFDYTWMRAVSPGKGTKPHGDSVFMNRGTTNLFTSWTPLGDVSFDLGGLIVLEGSNRIDEISSTYGQRDVDTYCENGTDSAQPAGADGWWTGTLAEDPAELRQRWGRRWLTNEFRAGDLLVFSIYTLHASLDNHSDRIRLSADSRYQLASDPVDERWIGDKPIGHGSAGKRGRIC